MDLPIPSQKIMHIDLNSFFASCEQQANPFLRGKSMGVGKRDCPSSAIVAASYPAKRQGIGLATRLYEAKRIDPSFELADSDFVKYYDLHNKFMDILNRHSPTVEVYSIDEAFLDFTHSKYSLEDIVEIGYEIKDSIVHEMGETITCSIGIAPNKLLTKIASDHDKPDGMTTIEWEKRFDYLDPMKINDVWGIGWHVSAKMHASGVHTLKQIRELDDVKLRAIVGGYYARLKLIANGYHFERVGSHTVSAPAKSMQHAHTLGKVTRDKRKLKSLTRKLLERIARRLRSHNQKSKYVFIGLVPSHLRSYGWDRPNDAKGSLFASFKLDGFTDHGMSLYLPCAQFIEKADLTTLDVRRLTVGVFNLTIPDAVTFDSLNPNRIEAVDHAFDRINSRFGDFTIRTADILHQKAKESELSIDRHGMRFHTD